MLKLVAAVAASLIAQGPQFVPGEVLVRFRGGTEAGRMVAQAYGRQPVDLSVLAPVADRLAAEVGVPLRAAGISSGEFCVMAVWRARLKEELARRLGAAPRVELVEEVSDTSLVGVRVAFAPRSPESRMRPDRLAARLGDDLGVPLQAEAVGSGRFALRVDLEALTTRLVERLKELPAVEVAQPNYIVKAFR